MSLSLLSGAFLRRNSRRVAELMKEEETEEEEAREGATSEGGALLSC